MASKGYGGLNREKGNNSKRQANKINGIRYNLAKSSSVREVKHLIITSERRMPNRGKRNAVYQKVRNGKLIMERYMDSDGRPYLDIDYTNHGNSKAHPIVPHEHSIKIDKNGNINRESKGRRIKK